MAQEDQNNTDGRRFEGQVAVITGASRGIGLGIARRLVAEGAKVAITARGEEALAAAVEELGADNAIGVPGKAHDPEHQDDVIAKVTARFGPIDHLVNNTGINPVYGGLLDIDVEVAKKIAEVNAISALQWTQKVHKASLGERGGNVVFIGSLAGMRNSPGIAFYGASKAMIARLVEDLAVEMGPKCRVNGVAPAVVKTNFATALYEGQADPAAPYPLKRLGEPADIAGPVAFLLSEDAAWITGTMLPVDGGLLASGASLL